MPDAQAPVTPDDVLAQIKDGKLVAANASAQASVASIQAGAAPDQVLLANVAADMTAKASLDNTTKPIDQLTVQEAIDAGRLGELSLAQLSTVQPAVLASLAPAILAQLGLNPDLTPLQSANNPQQTGVVGTIGNAAGAVVKVEHSVADKVKAVACTAVEAEHTIVDKTKAAAGAAVGAVESTAVAIAGKIGEILHSGPKTSQAAAVEESMKTTSGKSVA